MSGERKNGACYSYSTARFIQEFYPSVLSVSHIHHMVASIRAGATPAEAGAQAAFKCAYTTLFGAMTAYVFLRTGSLWPCIGMHMFCNAMGFPDFGFTDARHPNYRHRAVVIGAYLLGIFAYFATMYVLTPALPANQFL